MNIVSNILNIVALCIISVFSIFELLDMYGVDVKIFRFDYSRRKRRKVNNQINKTVERYIDKNKNLLQKNTKLYIEHIFHEMGIKKGDSNALLTSISDMRRLNQTIQNDEGMKNKIIYLLSQDDVIINLEEKNHLRKVNYKGKGIRYYINLTDTMNNDFVKDPIVDIMEYYTISALAEAGKTLSDIDKLVIPTGSNTIMGIELSKRLNVFPPIIMQSNECRVYEGQFWDGDLRQGDRVLLVHDVLYSGRDIARCINHLKPVCTIVAVIVMIRRTDYKEGIQDLRQTGIKVYSAMELNDEEIESLNIKPEQ